MQGTQVGATGPYRASPRRRTLQRIALEECEADRHSAALRHTMVLSVVSFLATHVVAERVSRRRVSPCTAGSCIASRQFSARPGSQVGLGAPNKTMEAL